MKLARISWWRSALPWALCALIAASLIGFLARYASRIPRYDHWETLGALLHALDQGTSIPAAIFFQSLRSNGHPFPFQNLADLATVYIFGGDLRAEQLGMIAVAVVCAWLLARRLGRFLAPERPHLAAWVLPAMMVMALSPSQMETWVGPVQFRVELLNLAVVAGMTSLPALEFRWWRIWAGVAWGIVATFCLASGLLYWIAALVPICALLLRKQWRPLLVWLVAADITVSTAFVTGIVAYVPAAPAAAGQPHGLAKIGSVIWFAVTALGNPLGAALVPLAPSTMVIVPLLGILGLGIAAVAALRLYRSSALRDEMWGWLGLVAYSGILALAVAWGRHAMGPFMPFSSRYITITWIFWPAVLALLLMALDPRASRAGSHPQGLRASTRDWRSWAVLAVFLAIGLGSINSAFQRWTPTERDNKAAALELPDICVGNTALINRMGPVTDVSEQLPVLLKWGIFTLPESSLAAPDSAPRTAPAGAVESVTLEKEAAAPTAGRCLRVSGWAGASTGAEAADQVLVAHDGVVFKRAWVGERRPRFGDDYDRDPHRAIGWVLYLDTRRLPKGARELQVYAQLTGKTSPVWIGKVPIPAETGDAAR